MSTTVGTVITDTGYSTHGEYYPCWHCACDEYNFMWQVYNFISNHLIIISDQSILYMHAIVLYHDPNHDKSLVLYDLSHT